jgi:hypothetical protein
VNRRLAVAPVLAAALFGLVACGTSTTGSANPTTGGQPANSGGTSTSAPTSGANRSPLASLQPCAMLGASVLAQYQMTKSDSGTVSTARTCTWTRPVDQSGVNGYTVGVNVRDTEGLGDVDASGYTVASDPVGNHQGKELRSVTPGDCVVVIGVSTHSRVDIAVNGGTNTDLACQVANGLAKVVEPQLPASS